MTIKRTTLAEQTVIPILLKIMAFDRQKVMLNNSSNVFFENIK